MHVWGMCVSECFHMKMVCLYLCTHVWCVCMWICCEHSCFGVMFCVWTSEDSIKDRSPPSTLPLTDSCLSIEYVKLVKTGVSQNSLVSSFHLKLRSNFHSGSGEAISNSQACIANDLFSGLSSQPVMECFLSGLGTRILLSVTTVAPSAFSS